MLGVLLRLKAISWNLYNDGESIDEIHQITNFYKKMRLKKQLKSEHTIKEKSNTLNNSQMSLYKNPATNLDQNR